MIKLTFEDNLKYQKQAIRSVVDIFNGVGNKTDEGHFLSFIKNPLEIENDTHAIKQNIARIAKENNIKEKDINLSDKLEFCVEMETGTGKTYVYLRTIFELHKEYNLKKFIILTPSIAIKEGILKTLEITKEHFYKLYNLNAEIYEYNSKKLTAAKSFCQTSNLAILVLNTQSFNKQASNIIHQDRDSGKIISEIREVKPIIIIDEPQEMEGEKTLQAIEEFNPLFKLKYSATHKNISNLVYRLSPFDAYNQNLVKKIEVLSVNKENNQSDVFIDFKEFITDKMNNPKAKLELLAKQKEEYKQKSFTIKVNDDLMQKTNNHNYRGYIVSKIWRDMALGETKIRFQNNVEISLNQNNDENKEDIFREQIKWTIKKHFEKKELLKKKGIKVLSLFFIDKVDNYIFEDSLIRVMFEEEYKRLFEEKYKQRPNFDISKIHDGYFSRSKQGFKDGEGDKEEQKEIYDKILKDKEKLLALNEPLEFIFSHTALGTGWDNPNVFNICTLRESTSIVRKRQSIGRGLRICVNQEGQRVRDGEEGAGKINLLTVIANESYENFVKNYQNELIDDYGYFDKSATPKNALKEKVKLTLNKEKFNSDDFKKLWQKISSKTKYEIAFNDEEEIIKKAVQAIKNLNTRKPIIKIALNKITGLEEKEDNINITNSYVGESEAVINKKGQKIDFLELIAKETDLSKRVLAEILLRALKENPNLKTQLDQNINEFIRQISNLLNEVLKNEMVRLVKYQMTGETISFQEEFETGKDVIQTENKGLYDKTIYDSDIEKNFAQNLEQDGRVKLFIKLPNWYKIDTPIGSYNPDFALVIEKKELENQNNDKKYYFCIETKGKKTKAELSRDERLKIECATKHFEALGFLKPEAGYLAPITDFKHFEEEFNSFRK
jgi:type III restriction enzyme